LSRVTPGLKEGIRMRFYGNYFSIASLCKHKGYKAGAGTDIKYTSSSGRVSNGSQKHSVGTNPEG